MTVGVFLSAIAFSLVNVVILHNFNQHQLYWRIENQDELSGYKYCPNFSNFMQSLSVKQLSYNFNLKNACNLWGRIAEKNNSAFSIANNIAYNNSVHREGSYRGHSANYTIVCIGDSLTYQLFIASQCELELQNSQLFFDWKYIFRTFLRPDIPCTYECLNNKTFLQETLSDIYEARCQGCRNGINLTETIIQNYNHESWWMHEIPQNTKVIIMGSGAWMSTYRSGYSNPLEVYHDMIQSIQPILQKFIHFGVFILWISLPPIFDSEIYETTRKYGWENFADFDQIAKTLLEPIGVIYVNVSSIARERKKLDRSISYDGIHWCNYGPNGIPALINQISFQLIVSETMKKLKTHEI